MSDRYALRLGDLRCVVTSVHERYAQMLATAYGTSLTREDGELAGPDLCIRITEGEPAARVPPADRLIVRPTPDAVVVETDPLTCEVRTGSEPHDISVAVHRPGLRADWLTYHFWIVFNRTLLLLDRVILHAAGLAYDGSVSVFVGPKGAGKSTISIALGRAGAEILAEDHLLAWRASGATLVSGCNGRMRVTEATERHFLDGRLESPTVDAAGVPKKEFAAARFFVARPHEPRAVDRFCFPRVGARFAVEPLSRRAALLRLMDVTGDMLRFHDRRDYDDFLTRLADLLDGLPCFDLELSPRLDDLARLLDFLRREA